MRVPDVGAGFSVQRHNILYSLRQDILYTFKVKQTPREEAFVAWKVRDVVSQRIELVVRVINGGESIAKLSQEYGISRATAHTWLKRYRQENSFTALQDRSRAPHQVRNRTSRQVEQQVLELRAAERWSGRKIQEVLRRQGIQIGARTIDRILQRSGCIAEEDQQRPALKRYEREQPNQLWQMDFKGQYRSDSGDCYPLSILDDHSRYAVGLYALTGTSWEPVRDCLIESFRRYGLPEQILMDHGTPWWGAHSGHGLSQLSVMLLKQDIRLAYSGIAHPQTQGKVERFHRTLSESLRHHGMPQQMQQWQPRLDQFRQIYNHVRPHEALALKVPRECYQPSPRTYRAKPQPWSYPSDWTVTEINNQGSLSYGGQRFFVSRALGNEVVAIQRVANLLLVRFRRMYVREIDLESGESRGLFGRVEEVMQTAATVEIQ